MDMTVPHRTPTPMRASSANLGRRSVGHQPEARSLRPCGQPLRRSTPPTPLPEKTTTVVLGRTHLMALAALLSLSRPGLACWRLPRFAVPDRLSFRPATESATGAAPPAAAVESAPPVVATPEATVPAPRRRRLQRLPVPCTAEDSSLGDCCGQPPAGGERGVATAGAGPRAGRRPQGVGRARACHLEDRQSVAARCARRRNEVRTRSSSSTAAARRCQRRRP